MFKCVKSNFLILRLPKVMICLNQNAELYRYFTKRHPKYKLIKNKTIGVCLLPIDSKNILKV